MPKYTWTTLHLRYEQEVAAFLGIPEGIRQAALLPVHASATSQGPVDVSAYTVVYVYPRTGKPGVPSLPGWDEFPGARGCTPQSCAFRDHAAELAELGATVAGLSAQTPESPGKHELRSGPHQCSHDLVGRESNQQEVVHSGGSKNLSYLNAVGGRKTPDCGGQERIRHIQRFEHQLVPQLARGGPQRQVGRISLGFQG